VLTTIKHIWAWVLACMASLHRRASSLPNWEQEQLQFISSRSEPELNVVRQVPREFSSSNRQMGF
jgi:hypothetical protein